MISKAGQNCSYTASSGRKSILMDDKAKLEYIWLDGYEPTQNMRSKTMVRNNFEGTLEECPIWMFDGSYELAGGKVQSKDDAKAFLEKYTQKLAKPEEEEK